jgi:hypothetical protein
VSYGCHLNSTLMLCPAAVPSSRLAKPLGQLSGMAADCVLSSFKPVFVRGSNWHYGSPGATRYSRNSASTKSLLVMTATQVLQALKRVILYKNNSAETGGTRRLDGGCRSILNVYYNLSKMKSTKGETRQITLLIKFAVPPMLIVVHSSCWY